ncbi:MAG: sugar ABC transporter permease [Lachnospiraceae bacterium]|nr:sugar ABC transporter permease [Lachnospiraceae bacterium]
MKRSRQKTKLKKQISSNWQLYVLMLPAVTYTLLFCYKPMYGILIAFQNFSVRKGIWGSEWVGFDNFMRLFNSYWFPIILKNTFTLSVLGLIIGFPVPIILALMLNELRNGKYRTFVQTVSYLPHFISTVVMCGIITMFLSPSNGVINQIIALLGGEKVYFMQVPEWFKWIYELSGIWQGAGWSSIIYFAALSSVDSALLEAADIDGASRMQKIWYINLPEIIPTIVVMFVLRCGQILSVGYEKVYLLQNDMNLIGSEIISTYVYKVGLEQSDFAFSTAVGLFNTVVNCVILCTANALSKKITKTGLF